MTDPFYEGFGLGMEIMLLAVVLVLFARMWVNEGRERKEYKEERIRKRIEELEKKAGI